MILSYDVMVWLESFAEFKIFRTKLLNKRKEISVTNLNVENIRFQLKLFENMTITVQKVYA